MKYKILISSALFVSTTVIAQDSRPKYFQQEVNNTIRVSLDDVSHYLRGDILMEYINNSPDTLSHIFIHLWPNAYSSDRTAYNQQAVENGNKDFYLSSKLNWGYIDSLQFEVDKEVSKIVPTEHKDVVKLLLNTPLQPGEKVNIYTPFKVQIPTTFSRLGHHEQSYQITQWFPKPAVYDKDGWHPMPYLDQGEFYSEYGQYDVSITLPKNYVVMATGNLMTESENEYLTTLSKQKIIPEKVATPPSSKELKTIRYTESNIHDFAWFADKTWAVRKGQIILPHSQDTVTSWSAFFPEHLNGWAYSLDYLKKGIIGYSKDIGDYPYKTVKAVEGPLIAGGGMEYPTVTIIIPSNDPKLVETVIVHEVGHNWFYGIFGSNERQNPWLDESINSFYENKILLGGAQNMEVLDKLTFLHNTNNHTSQPLNFPSTAYTDFNYGADVYKRGALAFEWLNAYVGEENFNAALRSMFKKHKFKHLSTDDFRIAFKENSPQSVDWFFDDYLSTRRPIDFRIQAVKTDGDSSTIYIKNKSGIAVPAIVDVNWVNDNNEIERRRYKTTPFNDKVSLNISLKGYKIKSLRISETIPDAQSHNNIYKNGRLNHIKMVPFFGLNIDEYKKIALAPALGYNHNNGFMLGASVHNLSIPAHKFQYALAPLYGFKSKTLNGTGFVNYTIYTPDNKWIHNIDMNVSGKTFGLGSSSMNIDNTLTNRYIKVSPEVIFNLRKPYDRSPIEQKISAKAYFIQEQNMNFNLNTSDSLYRPELGSYESNQFYSLKYDLQNHRTFNPYGLTLEAQNHKYFTKLSLEAHIDIDYHYKNSGLHVRGFIGKMFVNSAQAHEHYRYRFAGTFNEANDYLYDHTFIGRGQNEGFVSHQIAIREAGMKINTPLYAQPLGMTDDVIASINLTSDIPIKGLPVKLFADIMTFSNAKNINSSGNAFLWDAGLELDLWGMGSVYLPVIYSKDYKDYINSIYGKNRFFNTITFKINLNQVKWYKPIESIPLFRTIL